MNNNEFLENIALRLSPKVLQHISSNIYRQPASAFKELASNAFDASATNFEIKFKIKFLDKKNNEGAELAELDSIEITDDGEGISYQDFQSIFTNIGYSRKVRDLSYDSQDAFNKTIKSRPIIGRIGIGLFSVVAASDEFEIESKKKNDKCYVAKTKLPDFARLNVTNIDLESFQTGEAEIYEKKDNEEKESYTKITLRNFKKPFMEEIMENFSKSQIYTMALENNDRYEHLEQEKEFEEYLKRIVRSKDKIEDLDGNIDKFIFNLALQLPIEYLPEGPFKKCVKIFGSDEDENPGRIIEEIKKRLTSYKFNVFFSMEFVNRRITPYKIKLFKPISLPSQRDVDKFGLGKLDPRAFLYKKIDKIKNEIDDEVNIEISMYAYRQARRIVPHELRGILFRVYDVAIGDYDYEKFRPYTTSALQFQTSYEIFMDKGFQSAVNVDRESLYEASYSYRYLKKYFKYILGRMDEEDEDSDRSTSGLTEFFNNFEESTNDSGPNEAQKGDASDSSDRTEASFSEKLYKEFRQQNPKPLIKILNELKMNNTEEKKNQITQKQRNNPIIRLVREKYDVDIETIKKVEIEESKNLLEIEKTESGIAVKTKFKPDKRSKLPFIDVVLLAHLELKGEEREKFLSLLEELYKFYEEKES